MCMRGSRRDATRDEVPVSTARGNPQKNMLLPRTVTQPLETVSAPQTLTISNIGSMPLAISGLTFVGSDPGDFFVGSDLRRAPRPEQDAEDGRQECSGGRSVSETRPR